jgi:uncharacterized damage-inducible protein DinB
MDTRDFRNLYRYDSWANHRTLESCAQLTPEQFTRNLGSSFDSVRDTLVHIFGAEWIWLERWHGRTPTGLPVAADFPDLESVRRRWAEIERDLVDYIASLTQEDLQRVLEYKTTAGVAYSQPLRHCLQHLANHSTYHRGQIATLLRQLGAKATPTDLIAFYREQAAPASA